MLVMLCLDVCRRYASDHNCLCMCKRSSLLTLACVLQAFAAIARRSCALAARMSAIDAANILHGFACAGAYDCDMVDAVCMHIAENAHMFHGDMQVLAVQLVNCYFYCSLWLQRALQYIQVTCFLDCFYSSYTGSLHGCQSLSQPNMCGVCAKIALCCAMTCYGLTY